MSSRPVLRWLVPLAVVLALAATGLVVGTASADETLPPRSAEQLLIDLQEGEVDGLSGTVKQSADLGIPALPGMSQQSSEFSSLISGTHTMRVWYAAPDKSKVALLGDLSESSIIRNGTDVWTWSSRENAVTHAVVKEPARSTRDMPADAPKTPQEAAQRFLTAVDSSTEVSTDRAVKVAGRDAYELVLRPKDNRSLISSVRIAIDGTEHIALRVQVFAGDRPAPVASTAFTDVDFATPDDSVFAFSPPKGAKVTEVKPEQHTASDKPSKADREAARKARKAAEPTVVGEGWTTVVVADLPKGDLPDAKTDENRRGGPVGMDVQAYLDQLPKVSGSWGSGRLLAGTAFSVVITDGGRMAAGAVAPELLYDALG